MLTRPAALAMSLVLLAATAVSPASAMSGLEIAQSVQTSILRPAVTPQSIDPVADRKAERKAAEAAEKAEKEQRKAAEKADKAAAKFAEKTEKELIKEAPRKAAKQSKKVAKADKTKIENGSLPVEAKVTPSPDATTTVQATPSASILNTVAGGAAAALPTTDQAARVNAQMPSDDVKTPVTATPSSDEATGAVPTPNVTDDGIPSLRANARAIGGIPIRLKKNLLVPTDTVLAIALDEPLNSSKNKKGDIVRATVMEAVFLGPYLAIPPGARIAGQVVHINPKPDQYGRHPYIVVEFDRLSTPGQENIPMLASLIAYKTGMRGKEYIWALPSPQTKKASKFKYVVGGAIAGAMVNPIIGPFIGAGAGLAKSEGFDKLARGGDVKVPAKQVLPIAVEQGFAIAAEELPEDEEAGLPPVHPLKPKDLETMQLQAISPAAAVEAQPTN